MPRNGNLFTPQALVNTAIEQPRGTFLAPAMCTPRPARTQTGFIFEIDKKGDRLRVPPNIKGAPGSDAPRTIITANKDLTYACEMRHHETAVHDNEFAQAEVESRPAINAAVNSMSVLELNRDLELKSLIAASFTGDNTSSPSSKWDNYTDGDPLADIRGKRRAIYESTGIWCNALSLSILTLEAICNHPDVIDRVKYTTGVDVQTATKDQMANALAKILMLDKIDVAQGDMVNTSATDTPSLSEVWGGIAFLYRSEPLQIGTKATLAMPTWNNQAAGGGILLGFRAIEEYFKLKSTTVYKMEAYYDLKVLNTIGHYFTGVLT
jgi:hypothetical protein